MCWKHSTLLKTFNNNYCFLSIVSKQNKTKPYIKCEVWLYNFSGCFGRPFLLGWLPFFLKHNLACCWICKLVSSVKITFSNVSFSVKAFRQNINRLTLLGSRTIWQYFALSILSCIHPILRLAWRIVASETVTLQSSTNLFFNSLYVNSSFSFICSSTYCSCSSFKMGFLPLRGASLTLPLFR